MPCVWLDIKQLRLLHSNFYDQFDFFYFFNYIIYLSDRNVKYSIELRKCEKKLSVLTDTSDTWSMKRRRYQNVKIKIVYKIDRHVVMDLEKYLHPIITVGKQDPLRHMVKLQ